MLSCEGHWQLHSTVANVESETGPSTLTASGLGDSECQLGSQDQTLLPKRTPPVAMHNNAALEDMNERVGCLPR